MSYELEASYADGYNDGVAFAGYHFGMWQDAKGPPIPWPGRVSGIELFINVCLPMMKTALRVKLLQDARESGIDAADLVIPSDFTKGVEDGYRAQLTQLLQGLIKQRDIRGY